MIRSDEVTPRLPSRLQPGDTIGIVTPSPPISWSPSPEPMQELERSVQLLRDLGFQVLLGEHALKEDDFRAGTATERAEDVNRMFGNPDVRAIVLGNVLEADDATAPPAEELLAQVTEEYDFPILKCSDFGHQVPNTVLPVGTRARIDADEAELVLIEQCVS